MVQVRRPPRYRSPPPRKIPTLPLPIRFEPPSLKIQRKTSQHVSAVPDNDSENNQLENSSTVAIIGNNNGEESIMSASTSLNPFQNHSSQSILSELNPLLYSSYIIDESVSPLALTNASDGLLDKKHLPVFARFPFHVSLLPESMDTNVEDNIHRLRLRLIDSDLNHQRRSTDEYLKRTQKELSFLSPTPTEYDVHNVRPPSVLVYQRFVPKVLSRQASISILSGATDPSSCHLPRDRVGIESDVQNTVDVERELEILRLQESIEKNHRPNPSMPARNYSNHAFTHAHLPPPPPPPPLPTEKQLFSSTNMDDLIDSMARRHLAYRRLDAAIERQRRSNGLHNTYIEPLTTSRPSSFHNPQLNEDFLHSGRSYRNQMELDYLRTNPKSFNQKLRSRIDYYNRIQPDAEGMVLDDSMNMNHFSRLPPISSRYDSTRHNHVQNPLSSTVFDNKNEHHHVHSHQRTVPAGLNGHTEPYVELPSDIFLTSRADAHNGSRYPQQSHKSRPKSISKDRLDTDTRKPLTNRDQIRHKITPHINHHDSLTDRRIPNIQRKIFRRHLFKKTAIAVLFMISLRYRAFRRRAHQSKRSPSTAIHKIRLQEIIVALHRVYLQPEGAIYNALIQAINNSTPLNNALNTTSKNHAQAMETIKNTLQIVISKITEIMPKDGVLAPQKFSAVSALIQDGNSYPENYFWKCERDQLEFDKLKVINITKQRAILLLIGIYVFRALITTLLLKPVKYRLILGQITSNQSANLKVLASVLLYVGRRTAGSKSKLLALPHEWQLSLNSDKELEPIIRNSEISLIITQCEQSLRKWCEEYIRRIDASFGRKKRI